jgi:hypothetical protein
MVGAGEQKKFGSQLIEFVMTEGNEKEDER